MINAARLDELTDEIGEDDLAEVIGLFREEVEDALDALDTATGAKRIELLHFLKGSALNIGLDGVSELCRTAEAALRTDPNAAPDISGIRRAYDAASAELHDRL